MVCYVVGWLVEHVGACMIFRVIKDLGAEAIRR